MSVKVESEKSWENGKMAEMQTSCCWIETSISIFGSYVVRRNLTQYIPFYKRIQNFTHCWTHGYRVELVLRHSRGYKNVSDWNIGHIASMRTYYTLTSAFRLHLPFATLLQQGRNFRKKRGTIYQSDKSTGGLLPVFYTMDLSHSIFYTTYFFWCAIAVLWSRTTTLMIAKNLLECYYHARFFWWYKIVANL